MPQTFRVFIQASAAGKNAVHIFGHILAHSMGSLTPDDFRCPGTSTYVQNLLDSATGKSQAAPGNLEIIFLQPLQLPGTIFWASRGAFTVPAHPVL